jgi:tetratricopeptide (TPR) repeat protein
LAKGLGSKYEEHIEKALEIDRNYDNAGPLRAIGRYWYQVPWPKRDLKKSMHYLKEGVVSASINVRGHVYLAESYLKAGEKGLAREHLRKSLEILPDLKQEVDALRWKERAGEILKGKF